MQNRMAEKKTWIWLGLLLLLFMIAGYFLIEKEAKPFPKYVSESPSPSGVKAFYTYAKQHTTVKVWSQAPEKLPSNQLNQTLIMIEPFHILESEEIAAYEDFMKSGNTLLLFQHNSHGMFDIKTEFVESDADDETVRDKAGKTYEVSETTGVRLEANDQDEVLLTDDAGVIALKRPVGAGQLIVANAPNWLTNEEILEADHLPLVLYMLDAGKADTLLFDEYVHNNKGVTSVLYVYPRWFILLMLQAGLLTLLWLWYLGKRFGPVFVARDESVRFSDEGIRALAAWYLRGHRYHDSLVIQADYVKRLLQERWNIPYSLGWWELTTHLERRLPQMSKAGRQLFVADLPQLLKKDKVNKQEYVLWSKRLEQLRKEVEAE